MSQRSELIAALVDALAGCGATTLAAERVAVLDASHLPAAVVRRRRETRREVGSASARTLDVECVIYTAGAQAGSQCDAIEAAVHTAWHADRSIGGRAVSGRHTGTTWDLADGTDADLWRCAISYQFEYREPIS